MGDKEIIKLVLNRYYDELEKVDFKVHKNILPYDMLDSLLKFELQFTNYEISTYTESYHIRIEIKNLKTDKIIFNKRFAPTNIKKYEREEIIDKLIK